jgi:hypothetical protein
MLGIILAIGNILNGGSKIGQADGFEIRALSTCAQFKDNNKKTMLSFICKKMIAVHSDFPDCIRSILSQFNKTRGTSELLEKICREMSGNIYQASEILQSIKDSNDEFTQSMEKEIKSMESKAYKYFKLKDDIKAEHKKAIEFYVLKETDTLANTDNFISHFKDFF